METTFWKEGFRVGKKNPAAWQEICILRKEGISESQEHEITRLTVKGAGLQEREEGLRHFLPSDNDHSHSAALGWVYLMSGILLLFLSYSMLLLTLEPYALGWKAHAVSMGAALATALAMHWLLENWEKRDWTAFSLAAVCLGMMIFVHFLLSFLRAEILKETLTAVAGSSVEIDGSTVHSTASTFYTRTAHLLKLALPLLALVPELVMGMSFHAGLKDLLSPLVRARRELEQIRQRMILVVTELHYRQNLPEIFDKEFTAGARQAITEKDETDKRVAILIPIVLAVILAIAFLAATAFAGSGTEVKTTQLVILLDLTESRKVTGYDGQTEFQKDVRAIEKILSNLPPASQINILGITDHSFSKPFIIFEARLGPESGYFGEQIKAARELVMKSWIEKTKTLEPHFKNTDILGALELASESFESNRAERSLLIIFSDLQDTVRNGDARDKKDVKSTTTFSAPQLKGVQVYALGVNPAQKGFQYWLKEKNFWLGWFRKAGATVVNFSINKREIKLGSA
jgi:hypothetical protein